MWDNLTVDAYPISYIPYISNCYPGYGSNVGISSACNDGRCKFADNPKPVTLYGLMDEVEGTSCEYQLVCDYGLDITFLNRDLR